MARITEMVHEILKRIAHGTDRQDRAEARELLARLEQPQQPVRYARREKKGARK